ncbi:MAG: cobyrinic acid a,c-diamide synthase, partial [Gammaproteobacteria bacterium]
PLIKGYLDFDPEINICGVILNKVGGARHEGKLRAALERYTDVEVLGAIGRDRALEIPERHLGLIPANENSSADAMITRLSDAVSNGIDINRLIELASAAKVSAAKPATIANVDNPIPDVRIAIARDAAFGFYYHDDLAAFAKAGAELVPFDTLKDSHLPDVDGLFIGGGFPETHLSALAANEDLLTNIREALASGMPAYAECGGLMYLAQSIRWNDEKLDMVGAVPGDVVVEDRPQGRGYVTLEETGKRPWSPATNAQNDSGNTISAHEFHYARLENLPDNLDYAFRVKRGSGIDGQHDGLITGNLLAGFAHHRNTVGNPWVGQFVAFVREKSRYN